MSRTLSEQRSGNLLTIDSRSAQHSPSSPLSPVPGTPSAFPTISRSPSPVPGGGWSSPGLALNSGRSSPANVSTGPVMWESAKMRHYNPSGYSNFTTHNKSFFSRHMRRISSSLPRFNGQYVEKEKLGRGRRWMHKIPMLGRVRRLYRRMGRKLKMALLFMLIFIFCYTLFYTTPLVYYWRRSSIGGGGNKFVIILGANVGGGVMEWKGAREWAIERDSVRNKRKYAQNWGYDLEIVDLSTKKKYAHEWRESWEKVDFVRSTLRKYPKAEWVWWLDLNTFVMEPKVSLQDHLFNELEKHAERDINYFNPRNISHPFTDPWLDQDSLSPIGDGKASSINMLLTQDCAGFNLGSFFVRRSAWTEQLLDAWWDPVKYEQKHMQWEHKEQDSFEQMYVAQPWVRKHVGFLPQRKINSFPPGACVSQTEEKDPHIHYDGSGRDFVVNMAGCEWGRDCWGEMYYYREFSYWLNRNPWELFKEELIAVWWEKLTGHKVKL